MLYKKFREIIKYCIIILGVLVRFKKTEAVLPSMLSGGENTGPGRFIRNLMIGLDEKGNSNIVRSPFAGAGTFLVISSMPALMYKVLQALGIKVVLRVDGFSYPDLYDNHHYDEHSHRAYREFTLTRIKTNYQIQAGLMLADWVVFQSEFSREMSAKWLFNRECSFSIIPNGVDIELFRPTTNQDTSDPIISLHGNLRDLDIVMCVLSTFIALTNSNKFTNLRFRIIGHASAEVKALIESCLDKNEALRSRLELVGAVDVKQLSQLLPLSSISIHLTSSDACPNSVLESLACGVPVICQFYGGQSQLVGDGGYIIDTGKIYDYGPDVVNSAVKGVEEVLGNLDSYKQKARHRAESEFSLATMSARYDEVFSSMHSSGRI